METPNKSAEKLEALVASAHTHVEAAYAAMAKMIGPEFKRRQAQFDLSVQTAVTMLSRGSKSLLLSEAPTGTGKTIGYMIGALAARKADPSLAADGAVVVATATKALQHQIIANDAPALASCGLVALEKVVLAKGRGNYVCMRDADEMRARSAQAMLDIGGEDEQGADASNISPSDIDAMADAYSHGEWDGDFDNYRGDNVRGLRALGANGDTCVRKSCPYKDNCAFFKARDQLKNAEVVVTNHDLALIDAKALAEESQPTMPVGKMTIVFDEAHHLGNKVLDVCSSELQVRYAIKQLARKNAVPKLVAKDSALQKVLMARGVDATSLTGMNVEEKLQDLGRYLDSIPLAENETTYRIPSNKVPSELVEMAIGLFVTASPVLMTVSNIIRVIKNLEPAENRVIREARNDIRARCLETQRVLQSVVESAAHYRNVDERMARWVFRKGEAIVLHATPVEPGDYLNMLLWQSAAVSSVCMVSATLRDLGTYDGIRAQYKIPESKLNELTLPYSFPYDESTLTVVAMRHTPKIAERQGFLKELSEKLPQRIDVTEASLVIVPSWPMLKTVAELLTRKFGQRFVKAQGDKPVSMLLKEHKEDIDAGKGSLLIGVQTMAEGLDLPGKYCTHVHIATIPFAVPTSPLEQELSEMLGNNYFSKRSLPEAMRKLTQMAGRLLRKESDRGKITVYDNRLGSMSYGRKMLACLPPFTKVIESVPPPQELDPEQPVFDPSFNPGYN